MGKKIIAYTHLIGQKIFSNGELLFQSPENKDFPSFLNAAYRNASPAYPKFFKMDILSKLAFIASHYLFESNSQDISFSNMAIVIQNSSSSIVVDKEYQASIETFPSPSLFVYTLPNVMVGEIAIRYKIYGENIVLITEKFDPIQLVQTIEVMSKDEDSVPFLAGYIEGKKEGGNAFLMLIDECDNGIFFSAEEVQKLYDKFYY